MDGWMDECSREGKMGRRMGAREVHVIARHAGLMPGLWDTSD